MRLSRRNALIGLGTAAAGAGVIGGTGAFTTANADRSIGVSTTGDLNGAAVRIEADPNDNYDTLASSGGGSSTQAITIDFTDLNVNTIFTFDEAIGVTPNADDGPYNIYIDDENADGISLKGSENNTNNSGGGTTTSGGTTALFDLQIDLKNQDASAIGDDDTININIIQTP